MLDFYAGILFIISVLIGLAAITFSICWFEQLWEEPKKFLIIALGLWLFTFFFGYFGWKANVRLDIHRYEAIVEAFEEYRAKYPENYVLEPATNTEYEQAKAKLKYYDKLGLR